MKQIPEISLTFTELRIANATRCKHFRNAKGELCHPGGINDWPIEKWMNAVLGELGEAANILKKIDRGDFTLDEGRAALAEEFADTVTYLDMAASRVGIDLGQSVREKFNQVSEKVKSPVRL